MTTTQPIEYDDEATLLAGLRAGVSAAFEACVRQHGPRMLAVAGKFFKSEPDRDDAVQNALISAFRGVGSFDGKSKLTTWLHRVTINACLMKVRSRSRKSEIPIENLLPQFDDTGHRVDCAKPWSEDGYTQLAAKDSRQRVRDCIEQLPSAYREVLMLRDIQGLDTDEAAEALNCSAANVKTRLHRARQALRTLLEPYFVEA